MVSSGKILENTVCSPILFGGLEELAQSTLDSGTDLLLSVVILPHESNSQKLVVL